ncbi:MAG: hypothetical protein KGJ70_00705 [Gemmatimonadota bacterium]|nr:hypothetical protein [Gemmatimonadota bacterium]
MRPVHLLLAVAACAAALPRPAAAQETAVDEGTLVISRNGAAIGREAYRIVAAAAGGGQAYRATATLSFDSARISLRLTTDSAGAPLSYEAEVRVHGRLASRVDGNGRPGLFSTLAKTADGESARDYVMGPGPLLLDADAFDPYYFALLPPRRTRVSVIDPRAGTQATLRLEDRGSEPIRVGRGTITARHFALVGADGASRDVWVDGQGRLLRVAIPARGLVAQRDEAPR